MKTGIKKPEKKNVQNKIWERVEKTAGNIQNTEVPTTFTTKNKCSMD